MVSDTFIPQVATDRGDTPGILSPGAFPVTREDMGMSFTIPDLAAHSTVPAGYTVIPGSVRVPRWCGDVADNGDGSWTFLPAPDYHGPAPISFRTADALGRELAGSVLAEVLPANDAPEAGHVDLGQCTAGSRRIFTSYDLLSTARDADGDDLSIVSAQVAPELGSLQSLGNNFWVFTPAAGFTGRADIAFEVSDGSASASGTAGLEVMSAGGNRAPIVTPANLGATSEDTPFLITEARLRFAGRDPDGDPLRVAPGSVTVDEAFGAITDNGDGTWTFTPAADVHQEDVRVSFILSDGQGGWARGTALLDIRPVNDAPTAEDIDLGTILEDHALTFSEQLLLTGAHDVDGDSLDVSSVTVDPDFGAVTDNGDGTWTFTPAQNFYGEDIPLTFTVSDGNGGTATATAAIDILPVNDTPVAGNVKLGQIDEDHTLTITGAQLLANSHDSDGDDLSVTSVSVDPAIGSIVDNADGTWTFTPSSDLNGDALPITFTLANDDGETATGTATVDILPVNDAPSAEDIDLGTILEDQALTISEQLLLAGAHDVDGDSLDVSSVTVDPDFGTVTDNGDGTWTFTPAQDFYGENIPLSFIVSDGNGGTATATAAVGILPVQDAFEAGNVDLGQIMEDSALTITAAQLLTNSHDEGGGTLSVTSVSVDPAIGSIHGNPGGTWTFTPAADLNGDALPITFTVANDDGRTATGRAIVDILPVNDAPLVADVDFGSTPEDIAVNFSSARLLAGAFDVEGDALSVAAVTVNPAYGSVTDNGDGTWTFTPAQDFHGQDIPLSFTVSDGNGGTAAARASFDILSVNDAPVAADVDLGATSLNVPATFTLARLLENASDADGDPLRVSSITADPASGTVTENGDGTWTFTPARDFHGENTPLSFTVSDGNGGTATAVALLDVLQNHAPVIPDTDLGSLDEDTSLLFTYADILRDAFDADGDGFRVTSMTVNPSYGTITPVSIDGWRFHPADNFNGEVLFNFTVSDGRGGVTEAVARAEYLPVNDAPHAGSFSLATNEDAPLTITRDMVLSHCSDVEGDALSLKGISLRTADAGDLSSIRPIDGESFWLFEPAENSDTPAVLRYTVTDAHGATSAGRINIAVSAVADPLDATGTLQGYVDGLHRLDLDFSDQFPEHDGSEVYTLLSLSGLKALPDGAQLVSGGEVVWSAGDGDTLHLTREQSLGLADIFVSSPEATSFDISVRTQTVEQSNGHTAYGMATVHVDIVDRPLLASYDIAPTDQNMPDVFWYQNGDDWSAPSQISFASQSDREQFLNIASSPILFNNADPSDPDAIINSVDWHGDDKCLIHIEGFSTELNTMPGYGNQNWAQPYMGEEHGAMYDFWMFRWNVSDQGKTNNIFSPHLRLQYGDQTMQVVSSRTDSDFFEARSVVMGYMNEAYWLHDTIMGDMLGFDSNPYPEYLQAGWDSRFLFGTNGDGIDVLVGDRSHGADELNNVLVGLGGDDVLVYGKGHDTLLGGEGNDLLLIKTQYHNGFLDSYALTDYVIPQLSTNFMSPGEYGFYTVVEGKIDGGDGFDILKLQALGTSNSETTLYLNYAEHWIGDEPVRHDRGNFSTGNEYFRHFTHPFDTFQPGYDYLNGKTYGNFATFKYNMINIESIDLTGDEDDANTLNLNLDNLWLVTSNEYDKTLYVTGDANDTFELRDQANWHYVGIETGVVPQSEWNKTLPADDGYHHLVSNTGVAHLYVSEAVDFHVVGDTRYDGSGNIVWEADDSLSVDPFFHTVLAGGGDDTITIDPTLLTDDTFDVTDFTRIDGGDGFDVLKLGVNQAVTNDIDMWLVNLVRPLPIDNIEAFDIGGTPHQANRVVMHSGTVIEATDADNVLYIRGDADDTAYLSDAELWSHAGTSEMGGLTYDHYTFTDGPGTSMDLYIQAQMLTNMGHV